MKTIFAILALLFTVGAHAHGDVSRGALWPGQQHWDWSWEEKYAHWIEEVTTDESYFKRRGIRVDCADVIYGFRFIFSRINDLKIVLPTSRGIVTNETIRAEWARLPTHARWEEDQRFMAAFEFVMSNTATRTLPNVTYPVEISSQAMIPGTIFLKPDHHVQLITKMRAGGQDVLPIEIVQGSTPRSMQAMTRQGYWDAFQPDSGGQGGFRRFLWPVEVDGKLVLQKPELMPYYSLAQFDYNLLYNWERSMTQKFPFYSATFTSYVYLALSPNLNVHKMIDSGLSDLVEMFRFRLKLVENGYAYCKSKPEGCPEGTSAYDDWSTPSRDKRLLDLFGQIANDVGNARYLAEGKDEAALPHVLWNNILYNTVVFHWHGRPISLLHLFIVWREKYFSSNPNDPIERRWGFDRVDFASLPVPNPEALSPQ